MAGNANILFSLQLQHHSLNHYQRQCLFFLHSTYVIIALSNQGSVLIYICICILFHSQLECICDRFIMGLLYMWLDRIYPSKSIKKEDVRKTWVCIILKAKFCTFLCKQQTLLLICLQILFQLFLTWRRWEEPKNPNCWVFSKKHKKLIMLGISHTLAPSMNQSCALVDLRTNVCDPAILQYCNSIPQWIDCLFSPKCTIYVFYLRMLNSHVSILYFRNYDTFEVKDMKQMFHLSQAWHLQTWIDDLGELSSEHNAWNLRKQWWRSFQASPLLDKPKFLFKYNCYNTIHFLIHCQLTGSLICAKQIELKRLR